MLGGKVSLHRDLRLTAECSNCAHGKCTTRPPIRRSNRVQERNLEELVAWLAAGRDTTTMHLKTMRMAFRPPREQRLSARQYLKDLRAAGDADAGGLLAFERAPPSQGFGSSQQRFLTLETGCAKASQLLPKKKTLCLGL